MDCNRIREYITMLADDEIDTSNKEAVLKHIEACTSCSKEYRRIVLMKQLLFEDAYLNTLKSKNITTDAIDIMHNESIEMSLKNHKQKIGLEWLFMKKGILSACIAFVLIACSFIPFNGKSFAKSMENWIKQINLKYTLSMPDGTKAEISHTAVVDQDQESPLQSIYDERDKALAEAENITDPAEKQKKIDEILKETEAKIEEKRAADNAMLLQENTIIDYASIEEAKANIAIDFPVPNYIPEGYILDKVTYSKHNSGIQEMVRFTYKPSDISPTELASKDYLIINYILQNLGTADTAENQINITESFSKDTDMEEYAVLNNPGYILKKIDIKENKIFMSINTICEGFRASAGMTIHSSNMEGDMEKVKSELTKVMESFISQQ